MVASRAVPLLRAARSRPRPYSMPARGFILPLRPKVPFHQRAPAEAECCVQGVHLARKHELCSGNFDSICSKAATHHLWYTLSTKTLVKSQIPNSDQEGSENRRFWMYFASVWALLCQVLSCHLLPRLSSLFISMHILSARVYKCAHIYTVSFTLLSRVCVFVNVCMRPFISCVLVHRYIGKHRSVCGGRSSRP